MSLCGTKCLPDLNRYFHRIQRFAYELRFNCHSSCFLRNSISFGLGGFPSGVRITFLAASKPVSKTWGALGFGLVTPIWQMGGLRDYCFGRFLSSSLLPPGSAGKFHFKLRNRYSTTKYKLGDGFLFFHFHLENWWKLGKWFPFWVEPTPMLRIIFFKWVETPPPTGGPKCSSALSERLAKAMSTMPGEPPGWRSEIWRWSWCILHNTNPYIYIYICIYMYIYNHTYTYIYKFNYICIYIYIYIHIHYIYIYTYLFAYNYIWMFLYSITNVLKF